MLREKVLEILFKEDVTQKELTSRLKSSRSRMSEVLGKLEREKLILRKKVSQRTILVALNHSKTLRVGILRSTEYINVVATLNQLGNSIPFRVNVYDNSLEALKELMTGSEDMVASPLISGYFFYLIDRKISPVAGIASGGSGTIRRHSSGRIGTTPLSRMDKDSRNSGNYEQVYYKSIEDIIRAYKGKEIDAAQIWEPYLTMRGGLKTESDGICCCLFTVGNSGQSVSSFLKRYESNVESDLTIREKHTISRDLGKLIGVGERDVFSSLNSYKFTTSISKKDLENQVSSFGLPLVKEVDLFLERCTKVSV